MRAVSLARVAFASASGQCGGWSLPEASRAGQDGAREHSMATESTTAQSTEPPVASMVCPVTQRVSSEATNATTSAMSRGSPMRPNAETDAAWARSRSPPSPHDAPIRARRSASYSAKANKTASSRAAPMSRPSASSTPSSSAGCRPEPETAPHTRSSSAPHEPPCRHGRSHLTMTNATSHELDLRASAYPVSSVWGGS
jgi:hypothetical protein